MTMDAFLLTRTQKSLPLQAKKELAEYEFGVV